MSAMSKTLRGVAAVLSCVAVARFCPPAGAADVTVKIDRVTPAPIPVSEYETGVTFTQKTLAGGDSTALARARGWLADACDYYNVHIMGFGTTNPWADPSQPIDFTSLDKRMRDIRDVPTEAGHTKKIVITFCGCPDWMQKPAGDTSWYGVTNWNNFKKRPHTTNFGQFAYLCAQIAKRYDGNTNDPQNPSVKLPKAEYFQVWNEMADFWADGKWDMATYIDFYKQVWCAVKAAGCRPDAKIGGPYAVIEGTGSNLNWSRSPEAPGIAYDKPTVPSFWADDAPLTTAHHKQYDDLGDFMQATASSHRPDFFCFDRSVIYNNRKHDMQCYLNADVMALTPMFSQIVDQVHSLMDTYYGARIPIWMSEYYGTRYAPAYEWWRPEYMENGKPKPQYADTPDYTESVSTAFQHACYASMYNHMIRSGLAVALLWSPEEETIPHALWTSCATSSGGQPVEPHATLFKNIHKYFAPGTPLFRTESPSPDIEILAGGRKIMLINKANATLTVRIDDAQNAVDYYKTHNIPISLAPYQVKFFDSMPFVKNGSMSQASGGLPAHWNLSWTDASKPGTVAVAQVTNQYANPDPTEDQGETVHASLNIRSTDGQMIRSMRGQRINCYPDPSLGSTYVVGGLLRYNGADVPKRRVFMKMFDKDMNEIPGTWTSIFSGTSPNTWQWFSTNIAVPPNARFLELWLDYEGTGQIWLDAVRISAPATP